MNSGIMQYGSPNDLSGVGMLLSYTPEIVKEMIWETKNDIEKDIMCDACQDDFKDEEKGDDLVICEKCNVAVHQSCYGHGLQN